jgi:hypothetical protein
MLPAHHNAQVLWVRSVFNQAFESRNQLRVPIASHLDENSFGHSDFLKRRMSLDKRDEAGKILTNHYEWFFIS